MAYKYCSKFLLHVQSHHKIVHVFVNKIMASSKSVTTENRRNKC